MRGAAPPHGLGQGIQVLDDAVLGSREDHHALAQDPHGIVRRGLLDVEGILSDRERLGRDDNEDARALLDAALPGPLDARVRDLIVAETRGDPLALLELPRGLTPAELAADSGCPVPDRCRAGSRTASPGSWTPGRTRPDGWCSWRRPIRPVTGRWCGGPPSGSAIPADAADPARQAGLVEFGRWVRFQHPLARSAAYQSASFDRRRIHAALAEVTNPYDRSGPAGLAPGTGGGRAG